MVYDFPKTFKTYDANSYKKEDFAKTRCPKCLAVGRFKLHGSYRRYAIYFAMHRLICVFFEIKRIKCISCKTTHAVMPGDLIPYKALSLFVFILILVFLYLRKDPVLEIAKKLDFSHQFIYSIKRAFQMHLNNIRQHIRETSPEDIPYVFDAGGVVGHIKKDCLKFQAGYIEMNRRPCFMCKFFSGRGAPPIGIHAPRGAAT